MSNNVLNGTTVNAEKFLNILRKRVNVVHVNEDGDVAIQVRPGETFYEIGKQEGDVIHTMKSVNGAYHGINAWPVVLPAIMEAQR